jgi:hypothetical protein
VSGPLGRAFWHVVILALAASAASAQRTVRANGLVTIMKHRVDAGFGVEPSSGVAYGSEVMIEAGDLFIFQLEAHTGSLQARAPGAITRDVAEIAARVDVFALPWLTVRAGAGRRIYSTQLARQSWTMIEVGAEARLAFSERRVSGTASGAILPAVWVNALDRPDLAFTGAAGMEYRPGRANFALLYSLERYRFPAGAIAERREQTTALTLKAGWTFH